MTGKTFSLVFTSILAFVILASFVAADPRLEMVSIGSLSKSVNSTTFQIRTNSTDSIVDIDWNFVTSYIQDANGNRITFYPQLGTLDNTVNVTNPGTVTVYYTYIPPEFQFSLGDTYSVNIFANSPDVEGVVVNDTKTLHFINSYCEFGDTPSSTSDVIIKSISDETSGTGRDEWEWAPLDEIQLEVKVKNDGDDSERIAVKVALYSEDNDEFIELSGEDEIEDSMRIGDGNSEYFNFNFELPDDVEEGDYRLYVKAYVDGDEDVQCTSKEYDETEYFTEVSISSPDDGFLISGISVKDIVACGSEETVSFRLYNFDVGDEERFRVGIYNKELGIDLVSNSVELDNGDFAEFSFKVNTSKYTAEKSYQFTITVDYDYYESSKIYRETNDDFSFYFNVYGDCLNPIAQNAQMTIQEDQLAEQEIKAGKIIKIKATIENTATGGTGDEETIYKISVEGAEEFAKVKSINPSTLMLRPGESKDVSITLELSKDIEDQEEKMFNLVASFNNKKITQQLSLIVSEYTFWDSIKDHWILSLLVLIAILIVLIIAVLVIRNRYY